MPAVISHGQLISLLLHSIDADFGFEGWESLSNPDVHLLYRDSSGLQRFVRVWPGR